MLLVIDVGNTNTVFATFKGDTITGKWRLSTDTARTDDELAVLLRAMMGDFTSINDIIVSSVVPRNIFTIKELCRKYFNIQPIIVTNENINIKIAMDNPSEVGADRLVNAVAAYHQHQTSCIIIDFGTATTFDVISDDGAYLGGLIAPGINLSIDALQAAAAKLPAISIKKPESVIGKSTISAIEAGVYFGYKGLIEGIVHNIKQEYPNIRKIIATGGLASFFAQDSKVIDILDDDITLRGLYQVFYAQT